MSDTILPTLSLAGKTALVTGGRTGIGKALALSFARAGADVTICGRSPATGDLATVAEEIRGLGRRALAIQTDVTRKAEIDRLVARVLEEFGRIDVLVNNAGINIRVPLIEYRESDWDLMMDTHLKGSWLCAQAVSKTMIEQRRGSIINLSSIRAWKPATPRGACYSIAKAAIVMMTRVLALELGPFGIRVNAMAPGLIRTELSQGLIDNPAEFKPWLDETPLGRAGETSDLVGTALFLASDAAGYTTGQTLVVDGGYLA